MYFAVSVAGMIALAEVIAESKTMLRMDLRENDPYVGGLMALSLSLKVNQSLVRIDLDKELKKEPVRLDQCLIPYQCIIQLTGVKNLEYHQLANKEDCIDI